MVSPTIPPADASLARLPEPFTAARPAGAEPARLIALAERISGGDESALAQLYDATASRCYGLALAITGASDAAETATERAYVAFWSARAQADCVRAPLSTLLAYTRREALAMAASETVPDLLARLDPGTSVYRVVAGLAPEERRILARSFLQGMDAATIAGAERLPLSAVRVTLGELTALVRSARQ